MSGKPKTYRYEVVQLPNNRIAVKLNYRGMNFSRFITKSQAERLIKKKQAGGDIWGDIKGFFKSIPDTAKNVGNTIKDGFDNYVIPSVKTGAQWVWENREPIIDTAMTVAPLLMGLGVDDEPQPVKGQIRRRKRYGKTPCAGLEQSPCLADPTMGCSWITNPYAKNKKTYCRKQYRPPKTANPKPRKTTRRPRKKVSTVSMGTQTEQTAKGGYRVRTSLY